VSCDNSLVSIAFVVASVFLTNWTVGSVSSAGYLFTTRVRDPAKEEDALFVEWWEVASSHHRLQYPF
jgi:energy-converting hydrogenase Eha subunit G